MNEEFTFFWHGPFSQWYMRDFIVKDVTYNCAEQYMMAHKARLFGDDDMYAQIMTSSNPKDQKRLGRQVRNYREEIWGTYDGYARITVRDANMAKFTQHTDLRAKLLGTTGTLVEASPYDKIWGIGLREDGPRALNRYTWLGTNWLGYILTEVRTRIGATNANRYRI